ncbi:uncharacterized protein BO80DRAFT_371949 [Aspergillus ibericus CBS 121593]|uniref:HET-domain-containing protein n=1 Tax=Aspergillus ibericus CBS 121593 TaxID=1448316 RepID=A0A395HFM9_9EURO|nr:hypothetical protein BO80DRAFT_371949 [Aspergillus ibericus CBS 121593]RAL05798.1 hypothetical protein BO80DRAFT_371949 [Aspergillus ibericus CBS 121593]
MRLIDANDTIGYKIHEFFGADIPKYAILSHTWASDDQEVTLRDMQQLDDNIRTKEGFQKVVSTCKQARLDGLNWAWVDTCCIDKTSSAELTEAINSMYTWYCEASLCYAYLADVPPIADPFAEGSAFRNSRWFTRGWTLQELIAPKEIHFYNRDWKFIGAKHSPESSQHPHIKNKAWGRLDKLLEDITGIPEKCLAQHKSLYSYSVAQRMSWASRRQCKRVEDIAYSLLGIFDVNMPLLYGEGPRAFVRLQEEIMKEIDDHSLFAWTIPDHESISFKVDSIFAQSPAKFAHSHDIIPVDEEVGELSAMTKKGLRMTLRLRPVASSQIGQGNVKHLTHHAILNCAREREKARRIAIILIPDAASKTDQASWIFYRCVTKEHVTLDPDILYDPDDCHTVYIRKKVPPEIIQVFSPLASSRSSLRHDYSGLDSLTSIYNLASVLIDLGNPEEAEALHRRALQRELKELAQEHPSTLTALSDLAAILGVRGTAEEAEVLNRNSKNGRQKILPASHLDTIERFDSLGSMLWTLHRLEEAEAVCRRTLEWKVKELGQRHISTLATTHNLAVVLQALGRLEEASSLYRQALEGREKALAVHHPDTLTSIDGLASALRDRGRLKEAEALYREALKRTKEGLGQSDPSIPIRSENLAGVLQALGEIRQADAIRRREKLNAAIGYLSVPLKSRSILVGTEATISETQSSWWDCMNNFATFIQTIPDKCSHPVKIAVIGNGIDESPDTPDRRIVWSKSFCSPGFTERFLIERYRNVTTMATIIGQVCPKSQLYTADIEHTAESVASAIKWAVKCAVDIVSVDWMPAEVPGCLAFAFLRAQEAGIAIIHSNGGKPPYHPGLITVCPSGPLRSVIPLGYEVYLFPGSNVPVKSSNGISRQSGGHVATAIASGFAGLLLYCKILVEAEVIDTRRRSGQETILAMLRRMTRDYTRVPQVWDYLELQFKQEVLSEGPKSQQSMNSLKVSDLVWSEQTKKALTKVVGRLLIGSSYGS